MDSSLATPPVDARLDEALQAYWSFYEPIADELSDELVISLKRDVPELAPLFAALTPDAMAAHRERSRTLQGNAILRGEWEPYLEDVRQQAIGYARMGVGFAPWFQVIALLRAAVRRRLVALAHADLEGATRISDGMHAFIDIAMGRMGEAYIEAKEEIIRSQQEAIRELSTPVLQISDRVLIMPVVGVVDTHRARLLTEALLRGVRSRRARVVVMDITGVPIVDSRVANHIAQACEAARLMGATVILTGMSQEIAQTLVTIGADLPGVRTLGDLQSGIEAADRLLAGEPALGPS